MYICGSAEVIDFQKLPFFPSRNESSWILLFMLFNICLHRYHCSAFEGFWLHFPTRYILHMNVDWPQLTSLHAHQTGFVQLPWILEGLRQRCSWFELVRTHLETSDANQLKSNRLQLRPRQRLHHSTSAIVQCSKCSSLGSHICSKIMRSLWETCQQITHRKAQPRLLLWSPHRLTSMC